MLKTWIALVGVLTLTAHFQAVAFARGAQQEAFTIESEFEKLASWPANYGDVGRICEELARLRFQEAYPNQEYKVLVGLKYFEGNRTVGELDIVIFDKTNDLAILVGEVKCWKNMQGAMSKARKQLRRFKTYVQKPNAISHFSGDEPYAAEVGSWQFEVYPEIATIAQNGSKEYGFTHEIGLSLQDAMTLRKRLQNCQRSGACPTHR